LESPVHIIISNNSLFSSVKSVFGQLLIELVRVWIPYRTGRTVNRNHRAHQLVTQEIPKVVERWSANPGRYKIEGKTGMGNVSGAPYIATFNREITDGAKSGYYLVYLLSADLERLILMIGFGVYQFEDYFGKSKKMYDALDVAVQNMRSNTKHLVGDSLKRTFERTNSIPVRLDNGNYSLLRGYERCSVYSITYQMNDLPSDEELKADYLEYLHLYDSMSESLLLADVDDYVYETVSRNTQTQDSIVVAVEKKFVPRKFAKKKTGTPGDGSSSGAPRRQSKKSDKVGKTGEQVVVQFERQRLRDAGRTDLAEKVIWHRDSTNRTPGWDVTSFEVSGDYRFIEVKSTEGAEIRDVELTPNEWIQAQQHSVNNQYFLYLVANVFRRPEIQIVSNPASYVSDGLMTLEISRYTLWLGARPS
jgi:hypothetical protein